MVEEKSKVIKIEKTPMSVRLFHVKKDLVYFLENMLGWKLQPYQKDFIKDWRKKMDEHQFAVLIEVIDNCKYEIIKKLEEIRCGIIDVEEEITELSKKI